MFLPKINFLLLFIIFTIYGETKDTLENGHSNSITTFYLSDFNKHGGGVGINHNLLQTSKYKIIAFISIGTLTERKFNTSVMQLFSQSVRRTFRWGLFIEQTIFTGYCGTRYEFDQFQVDNNGEIVNIGKQWTHSIMAGSATELGYDFSKHTRFNFQPYVKFNSAFKFPNYDQCFLYKNIWFQTGVTFHPKWLNRTPG
jgi:hypothetical protein